jgi:hypothetical protein
MSEINCYFCKHGKFHQGDAGSYWQPPEPSYTECQNDNVNEELFEQVDFDEEKLPIQCGHYDPRMVEKCGCCDREMNIPEHDVKFFFEGDTPVCSKKCQDKWYQEYEESMKVAD